MPQTIQDLIQYCIQNEINLTNQQELILEAIAEADNPVTAHELLTKLKELNPKANRMTIHRGVESLLKFGLIHRVAFNNTYTLCNHLSDHSCQILVCQKCGRQTELHSHKVLQSLREVAAKNNFIVANPIEIPGYCANC